MSNHELNRRQMLQKSATAAGLMALAGCSSQDDQNPTETEDGLLDSDESSTNQDSTEEQDTETSSEQDFNLVDSNGFDLIVDPNELFPNYVDDNGSQMHYQIREFQELNEDLSSEYRQRSNQGLTDYAWGFEGLSLDDIVIQVRDTTGINIVGFDDSMTEQDILEGYEERGLSDTSLDTDYEDWEIRRGEISRNGQADTIVAVKNNNAVVVPSPNERGYGDSIISDPESAMDVALATVEDDIDSIIEGDEIYAGGMRAVNEYLQENDVGEMNDAPVITGFPKNPSPPEDNVVGRFTLRDVHCSNAYEQTFEVLYENGEYNIGPIEDVKEV